jgi:hypothetical protein
LIYSRHGQVTSFGCIMQLLTVCRAAAGNAAAMLHK